MQTDDIDRFLRTGDHDPFMTRWPGRDVMERLRRGTEALSAALLAEVRRREAQVRVTVPDAVPVDLKAFARRKLEPMVRGLFSREERDSVLAVLDQSVVFLTPATVESVIRRGSFLETAWQVANIYLAGIGAVPLGDEERCIVGMSVETTCYVSLTYFSQQAPFADYVVHEAAHVFHNTKRRTVGLRTMRRQEWLLPIAFRKRETFAYACETYSRILELGKRPADRRRLLEDLRQAPPPPDDSVDHQEYLEILTEAVGRRNGWKAILGRCSQATRGS
jgi:hypothetical protein